MKKARGKNVTSSGKMKRLSERKFLRGRRRDTMRVTETEIRATEGVHWYTTQVLKTVELPRCTQ